MHYTGTKRKKSFDELDSLLSTSEMTVVAKYRGFSVKSMQELRKAAKESDTRILVVYKPSRT